MNARYVAHGRTEEPLMLYPLPPSARYAHCFTPAFGWFLRTWLRDYGELPEHTVDAVLDQWDADGRALEAVDA